ncbi:hypothetical protein B0O99DRAFT_602925 [Bisporella sp. PMI_857]|nr:hypothetical protein B0O99DRAFT_602925 [Bisporella sp. PMI_857]
MAFIALASLDIGFANKSAGCGKNLTIGSQTYTVTANGKQSQYIMKLPYQYDNNPIHRLTFSLAPARRFYDQNLQRRRPNSGILPCFGLPALANNSAIYVVPNGINNGCAGGNDPVAYCGQAAVHPHLSLSEIRKRSFRSLLRGNLPGSGIHPLFGGIFVRWNEGLDI